VKTYQAHSEKSCGTTHHHPAGFITHCLQQVQPLKKPHSESHTMTAHPKVAFFAGAGSSSLATAANRGSRS